jgi:hypothetical protein
MSEQNNQLSLFDSALPTESVVVETDRQARRGQITEVVSLAHGATLDPELVELQAENLENGAGFTPRMTGRSSESPAEAGENTMPRPSRQPHKPKPPTSAQGKLFADLGRIPQHELARKHEREGWENPKERQTLDKPAA